MILAVNVEFAFPMSELLLKTKAIPNLRTSWRLMTNETLHIRNCQRHKPKDISLLVSLLAADVHARIGPNDVISDAEVDWFG